MRGGIKMRFLLSHWHCIVPLVLIFIFVFKNPKEKKEIESTLNENKTDLDQSIKILEDKFISGDISESEYLRKRNLLM